MARVHVPQQRVLRLLGRRLFQIIPVLILATFISFGLIALVPGDIAVTLAGEYATDERLAEIRKLYGLDRPFLVQYADWLGGLLTGDLATSIYSGEPVWASIVRNLPPTVLIVLYGLILAFLIGTPMGILAARYQGSILDRIIKMASTMSVAMPNFWLAILLIAYFAMSLGWFPVTGFVAVGADPVGALHYATLPAIAVAAAGAGEIARQVRGSLMEFLLSQNVRTLTAKGLPLRLIFWKHGLRNVGVNLLTVFTLLLNRLLGATVVIETVFAIPGIGSLIVTAAVQKDFPVIQGVTFIMVLIVVSVNLVADIIYGIIDPRIA